MYGVPADMDLSSFCGTKLTQICLGPHQIQFHFSGTGWDPRRMAFAQPGGSIHVECAWRLIDKTDSIVDESLPDWTFHLADRDVYRLHLLLMQGVVTTSAEPPKSVSLTFEGGYTLRIFDDSEHYESFQVYLGNGGGYIV